MQNHSHVSSQNEGAISKTVDIISTSTYEELSLEFQKVYPFVSRAIQLIGLMYNRLTLKDKLSHKEAISKIYEDHKHLQGFSERNIRRSLMSLDNPNIPHRRSRKIRPTWPNSESGEALHDTSDQEAAELSGNNQSANQDYKPENTKNMNEEKTSDADCPKCDVLLVQYQKLEQEKNKALEGLRRSLQIIRDQENQISEIRNAKSEISLKDNDRAKVLEQEIALLYEPVQRAMASTFKLKENKLWLTIRHSKDTGNIIAVYTGRKSMVVFSSQSILSNP
jgi:hypothetical protein